ncbi:MAG TPA: cupin domain-containing protein [Candidatus Limnocylindria bacterium]|nr:cupin domain-containing protein [Candidatus Limnocylindria bacterium]
MQVVRFGVGHRRPDGPAGTTGLQSQVIHSDGRGLVAELAFARNARIEPHTNPNTTWFVVIEGGGWVVVGDDVARVSAGEAVLWPAHELHGAWTDVSEMRAIVVELAGVDDAAVRGIIDGQARAAIEAGTERARSSGDGERSVAGGLAPRERSRDATAREGEPY